MTSRISFPKLLKEDMKKRMWLTAVSTVLFMIIIPLFTLLRIEGRLEDAKLMGAPELTYVKELFAAIVGLDGMLIIGLLLLAVVSGITAFSYLHSQSQTDFYHSLPVKRETWFAVSYVGSLLQVMLPYVLGYGILLLIGVVKKVAQPEVIRKSPYILFIMLLFYLLTYSATILVMMITGKLIVAFLGIAVVLFYAPLIGALSRYTMLQGFSTYISVKGGGYGLLGNLFGDSAWGSPILAYWKFAERYAENQPLAGATAGIVAAVILISALALFCYRIRPSEAAGKALAFSKLETVIKVVLSVTGGILFGVIAGSQNREQGMNSGWLFGVGILTVILVGAVIEFIYQGDLKLILKKKGAIVVSIAATLAVLMVIQYDIFGYDAYFPQKEQLEAMSMDVDMMRTQWADVQYSNAVEYKEILDMLRTEDFDIIYELAKNGLSPMEEKEPQGEYINIAYYLKNGRKVYRKYYVDVKLFSDCLQEVMKNQNYREAALGFKELEASRIEEYTFFDFLNNSETMKLTESERERLVETYKREMMNQPVSTFTDGKIIGELRFDMKEGNRLDYFGGKIYREFKEVRALLEEYGYSVPEEINLDEVRKITIEDYNKDEVERTEIREPQEMQKILDRLCYENGKDTVPNTYVEIDFKNSTFGNYSLKKE